MRFLVTGGAGFLGSALANQLAQGGHEVRVLDDLTNGDRTRLHRNVMFTKGSVTDVPRLWSLLQEVDCVYHLAARVSTAESVLYPSDYNTTNVGGTVSLMEAMRDAGVGRVVLTSSAAVYGANLTYPALEDDPVQPDTPYAVSKLSAEQYVNTIGQLWGIETVALRIFNAYGPQQPLPVSHAPVVPRFLKQAISGGSIVVHRDGTQSRDFVYVDDVTSALVAAATANNINRQVINIGSGVETSLNDLISCLEKVANRKVNRIDNNAKKGGARKLVADIRKAKRLLGYTPTITLEEGINRMTREDERFNVTVTA